MLNPTMNAAPIIYTGAGAVTGGPVLASNATGSLMAFSTARPGLGLFRRS